MTESLSLTSDEKLMGAVAHIFGPVAALIVWATQKDGSRFVKFQSLQALIFDLFIILTTMVLFFCFFGVIFLGMFASIFAAVENASSSNDFGMFFAFPFIFPFAMMLCTTPVSMIILAFRLVAGVSILNGRDYRYPLAGKWLENFLKT
jgi:uncharacterized Tic20 family protein